MERCLDFTFQCGFKYCAGYISSRADNKVGTKAVKYLSNALSRIQIVVHRLKIELYIVRRQLALYACHLYRCKVIACLFDKLRLQSIGRTYKKYICIGKYFLQFIRNGKCGIYMSSRTSCRKRNVHCTLPFGIRYRHLLICSAAVRLPRAV